MATTAEAAFPTDSRQPLEHGTDAAAAETSLFCWVKPTDFDKAVNADNQIAPECVAAMLDYLHQFPQAAKLAEGDRLTLQDFLNLDDAENKKRKVAKLFREVSRRNHADKGGGVDTTVSINAARDTLLNVLEGSVTLCAPASFSPLMDAYTASITELSKLTQCVLTYLNNEEKSQAGSAELMSQLDALRRQTSLMMERSESFKAYYHPLLIYALEDIDSLQSLLRQHRGQDATPTHPHLPATLHLPFLNYVCLPFVRVQLGVKNLDAQTPFDFAAFENDYAKFQQKLRETFPNDPADSSNAILQEVLGNSGVRNYLYFMYETVT